MNNLIEGSDEPLVSIAMCTYNGSHFLDQQIQSILNQTYQHIEFVVVDDCSTDDTFALLQLWQKKYPSRFKIYRNETNLGYNKNFEKAITLCEGDFIAVSDQDDIWLPHKIEKLIKAFTSNEVLLVHCASVHLKHDGLHYRSGCLRWEYHFSGNDTRKLFLFNQVQGHNIVFRKSLKAYILPLPEQVYYDWWMAIVATCHGRINSVPEYLVYHRMHNSNAYYKKQKPPKAEERLYLLHTLKQFASIQELKPAALQFLNELISQLTLHLNHADGKVDLNLFRFIYKNRWLIFGHKKRVFPEWTLLKASLKYARS